MRSIVYVSLFVARWFAAIGAFRSSLLFRLLDVVSSQVRFVVGRLLCFLIVGIQASRISIPLSPLMLLGWSLIWIVSLTLRVYQWGSRSINLTSFQIGNRKRFDLIAWWRLAVLQSKRRDQQLKAIPSWDKRKNVHLTYLTPRWTINTSLMTLPFRCLNYSCLHQRMVPCGRNWI